MQTINGHRCDTFTDEVTKERGINVYRGNGTWYAVPLDMARLGAGKDAWMRKVVVTCTLCPATFRLEESDSTDLCPACYDDALAENARADGDDDDRHREEMDHAASLQADHDAERGALICELAAAAWDLLRAEFRQVGHIPDEEECWNRLMHEYANGDLWERAGAPIRLQPALDAFEQLSIEDQEEYCKGAVAAYFHHDLSDVPPC